jgi:hypothetical protein
MVASDAHLPAANESSVSTACWSAGSVPVGVAPIARTVLSHTGAPGVRTRMPFRSEP